MDDKGELKIVRLREQNSRQDVPYRGKFIQLRLDECECGIRATFVLEEEPPELPAVIKMIFNEAPRSTFEVIAEWHWKPKWWQRVLRMRMEPALKHWVKETRHALIKDIGQRDAREARVSAARRALGLVD